MIDQLTRDIVAGVIVAGGLFVMILSLRMYRACKQHYRWIFLVKALAGFGFAVMFTLSLLRLYNGADIVDPIIGRPVIIIALLALALGATQNYKTTGGCP